MTNACGGWWVPGRNFAYQIVSVKLSLMSYKFRCSEIHPRGKPFSVEFCNGCGLVGNDSDRVKCAMVRFDTTHSYLSTCLLIFDRVLHVALSDPDSVKFTAVVVEVVRSPPAPVMNQ
jgi:hypothetical protein